MARREVEEAVEARLRANWTASAIVVGNEEATTPGDGSAFVTVQFPFAETRRYPLNRRLYREDGRFRIVISIPTGTGMETVRAWGEQLAALFRDVKFSGVQCGAPGSPATIDEGTGGYHVAAFTVPFTFYFED